MNTQVDKQANIEEVEAKAKEKENVGRLLDIYESMDECIDEFVSVLEDGELGAMRDEMSRPMWWGDGSAEESYKPEFVDRILWCEIEKRCGPQCQRSEAAMNTQVDKQANIEEVEAKAKENVGRLFDIVGSIYNFVSVLEDGELGAMRDEMSRPTWWPDESREAYSKRDFVSGIVWREIDKRWENEKSRLMASSLFYRFYNKRYARDGGPIF